MARLMTIVFGFLLLTGCANSMRLGKIPDDGPTMGQIYHEHTQQNKADVERYRVNTPKVDTSRGSEQQLNGDFKLIENPLIDMYIYPHFEGKSRLPVAGMTTQFALYDKPEYVYPWE